MLLRIWFFLGFSLAFQQSQAQADISSHFEEIKNSPKLLQEFMENFPKGGDIHSHLVGAVYAEDILDCLEKNSIPICLNAETWILEKPINGRCEEPHRQLEYPLSKIIQSNLIRHWSIPSQRSHSQIDDRDFFFAAFAKYKEGFRHCRAESLVSLVKRLEDHHMIYLEIMINPGSSGLRNFVENLPMDAHQDLNLSIFQKHIDLSKIKQEALSEFEQFDETYHKVWKTKYARAENVEVKYLYQVCRNQEPIHVLASLLLAFQVVEADSRFVGINLVCPEDHPIALGDHDLHLSWFKALKNRYPNIPFSIHAGELRNDQAKEHKNHIRSAVEIAGAYRIGHGTSLIFEDDKDGLLQVMSQKLIPVEICLSSNAHILHISGNQHPFKLYREHQIPVCSLLMIKVFCEQT